MIKLEGIDKGGPVCCLRVLTLPHMESVDNGVRQAKYKDVEGGGAGFTPPSLQLPQGSLKAVVQVLMITVLRMDMTDKQQWVEMFTRLVIHEHMSEKIGGLILLLSTQELGEDF